MEKLLSRKASLVPILLLVAVLSGAVVGAILYFSVEIPGTVTVKTTGELAVTDLLGNVLTSLDFGEIDPDGAGWTTIDVLVKNLSNADLLLNIASTSDISFYAKANGMFVLDAPLAAGGELRVELMLIIEEPVEAGIHNFVLTFTGGT